MKKPDKKSGKSSKQGYLIVLLLLLPVFVINLGYSFFTGIEIHWKKNDQQELANQEIETLAAGSEFAYQFNRLGGNFNKTFQSTVEADIPENRLASIIEEKSRRIFRSPFPEYDLFAFRIKDNGRSSEILFARTQKMPSKRMFTRAFEHLVKVNKKKASGSALDKQNERMVASILGGESRSEILGRTQRGKASFAFYQYFPHWFMWDYFEIKGKGTFGFFLLTRNDEKRKVAARLLALRDLRERGTGLGAFIPLYSGFGGAVLQPPLHKSPLFMNWARKNVSSVEKDLKKWLKEGTPPVTPLGNYQAFSYLGKGHTHLSVFLMPAVKSNPRPMWLFLFNLIFAGYVILLLFRGFITGYWPSVNLKLRFILTYMLAATIPIGLLVISAYGYVNQYRRATHFQSLSRLQFHIKQFDARKAQIYDEYRKAFDKVFKDQELKRILKAEGSDSKAAKARILHFFSERKEPLPLLCFAIMDENGNGEKYFGGHTKEEADPAIDAFKFPIAKVLRSKILLHEPGRVFEKLEVSAIQETSSEAYKSITKNDLAKEVDKRRSFPITRQLGNITATQMHELIKIDGVERFALFLVWDDQALDRKIFKNSVDYFGVNNPDLIFVAYNVTPQGLEPLIKFGRDAGSEFQTKALQLADLANFRGSYAGKQFDNLSLLAMPSKKYDKTIIVGGTYHSELELAVEDRLFILALILALSLIVVLLSGFMSARLILDPITDLKSALDQVINGRLDIEITSQSKDELGALCKEFSAMTRGLRDREKLASLISDQAVEAISRTESGGGLKVQEDFKGVALVSDIRNFTGLCEEYSPDDINELLNEHFAQMAKIISEHGGRIYKFIGDAIEAVFPENDSFEESASRRAFNSASLMLIRLLQINRARARSKKFQYRIGIGLAYGPMMSGPVGSLETRLDYAILGEPLKKAAKLEAMSTVNPAFPLIIDEKIAEELNDLGMKFSPIEGKGIEAFSLSELGEGVQSSSLNLKADISENSPAKAEESTIRIVEAGGARGLVDWILFFAGCAFILLLSAGVIWGKHINFEAWLRNEKLVAVSENLRLYEQLKTDSVMRSAFESQCLKTSKAIEQKLDMAEDWKSVLTMAEVEKAVSAVSVKQAVPEKMAIYRFADFEPDAFGHYKTELVFGRGWDNELLEALRKQSEYRRFLDSDPLRMYIPESDHEKKLLKKILGDQMAKVMLQREFFGKVSNITADSEDGYFYWGYLTVAKPGNSFVRDVAGIICFSIKKSTVEECPELVVSGFANGIQEIGVISGEKDSWFSEGFPGKLAESIKAGKPIEPDKSLVILDDSVSLSGKDFRIVIIRPLQEKDCCPFWLFNFLTVSIAVILLIIWYQTVSGNSIVARSLAAKLWLALLISSILPLLTVFYVFGLYQNEDYSVRVSQERVDMQRATDLFELRESFSDPLAWRFVKEKTMASETVELIKSINYDKDPEKIQKLRTVIQSWYDEHSKIDPYLINYSPRDIVVAGRGRWGVVATDTKALQRISMGLKKESSEPKNVPQGSDKFGLMLKHIASSMIARAENRGSAPENIDSLSIEGEMYIETGLFTVRSMFGDDVYIKLSHGLGLPVLMHVFSGTAGLVIHPVPDIENPVFVIVWLILFEYENYLSRIAEQYDGRQIFFPVETHRYGAVVKKDFQNSRFDLTRISSWIATSNLPVSGKIRHNNQWYLLEGRPGVAQMTSLIIAMTPEKQIDDVIAYNRIFFLIALSISVFLILIIARSVASDILLPVKDLIDGMQQVLRENYGFRIASDRNDELGLLCHAFDGMMKGLEEKSLMGRMLSKNAQKFSLQEANTGNSKSDMAILYIGIPNFSAWMTGVNDSTLFDDLRRQVSLVSGKIIGNGGDVDKIIGEKILAVFHADNGIENAVKAACRTAAEIVRAENRGELMFPVAVGVNFGKVITGFLGVGEKRDFTVIGDAVNVTARIESHAEMMRYQRCLVSEDVMAVAGQEFMLREYGEVELKGKSVPMKVYQLSE